MRTGTNVLTPEQQALLLELSNKPELNLVACDHSNHYYGVSRADNRDDINTVTELIRTSIPSIVEFSNFTGESPNRIRMQTNYNYGAPGLPFYGVNYCTLDEILNDTYIDEED